jgi:hypothetical protein
VLSEEWLSGYPREKLWNGHEIVFAHLTNSLGIGQEEIRLHMRGPPNIRGIYLYVIFFNVLEPAQLVSVVGIVSLEFNGIKSSLTALLTFHASFK